MTTVEYNPEARFDVETTDIAYLEHPTGSLEATIYQPQGEGPFPALWTPTADAGSSTTAPPTTT